MSVNCNKYGRFNTNLPENNSQRSAWIIHTHSYLIDILSHQALYAFLTEFDIPFEKPALSSEAGRY